MKTRVMIDLESLGTKPGCAILEIGAVPFTKEGPDQSNPFHARISPESNEEHGLTAEAGTAEWWMQQPDKARQAVTGGKDLSTVLENFAFWIGDVQPEEMWAKSPEFDCAILRAAYEAVGIECPWPFYINRDVRTAYSLAGEPDLMQKGTSHTALADAIYQARKVAKCFEDSRVSLEG